MGCYIQQQIAERRLKGIQCKVQEVEGDHSETNRDIGSQLLCLRIPITGTSVKYIDQESCDVLAVSNRQGRDDED
jgi:hypothetical protein